MTVDLSKLTPREWEVFVSYSRHEGNRKKIAAQLRIGVKTVDSHIEHSWSKLGCDLSGYVRAAVLYRDTIDG